MTSTVNVQDAKTHLSRLLRQVEAGQEIAIARAGKVIARLVRVPELAPRTWGHFVGQVQVAPGAFDPLTPEQADEWENSPL